MANESKIREAINLLKVAEIYLSDGAPITTQRRLAKARALLEEALQPANWRERL